MATVIVRGAATGFAQEIEAGHDLLLAALGACTSMTVSEGVTVQLRHAKIHAEDCAECETKEGMLDRIEREISLTGPLDAEQRGRLLEIATRCPVHRTLVSEIDIRTRLV